MATVTDIHCLEVETLLAPGWSRVILANPGADGRGCNDTCRNRKFLSRRPGRRPTPDSTTQLPDEVNMASYRCWTEAH